MLGQGGCSDRQVCLPRPEDQIYVYCKKYVFVIENGLCLSLIELKMLYRYQDSYNFNYESEKPSRSSLECRALIR